MLLVLLNGLVEFVPVPEDELNLLASCHLDVLPTIIILAAVIGCGFAAVIQAAARALGFYRQDYSILDCMTYRLSKLAPVSYDVILNGVITATLVRSGASGKTHRFRSTAELLVDLEPAERPAPFVETEHEFNTLEEACGWLGVAERPSRTTGLPT